MPAAAAKIICDARMGFSKQGGEDSGKDVKACFEKNRGTIPVGSKPKSGPRGNRIPNGPAGQSAASMSAAVRRPASARTCRRGKAPTSRRRFRCLEQ